MACLHLFDACPDPRGRGLNDTIDVRHKWNVRKCDWFEPYAP
jgi:hypothetical protein